TQVREEVDVVATRVFEGVGQHGEAVGVERAGGEGGGGVGCLGPVRGGGGAPNVGGGDGGGRGGGQGTQQAGPFLSAANYRHCPKSIPNCCIGIPDVGFLCSSDHGCTSGVEDPWFKYFEIGSIHGSEESST